MTEHAKLSASGSKRWMLCAGSVKAEEGLPDKSSPQAEDGTLAHAVAESMLTGRHVPECSAEMMAYVQVYVDYVHALAENGELFVETRVDFSPWVPDGFGTSDAFVIGAETNTLDVIDLKYGIGVRVDADNNSQGMLYALGIINDFGFLLEDVTSVRIHIVQPRLDNISMWEISRSDLLEWAENVVKPAADLALSDNPPRVAGEEQCQFCKAKATCPALLKLTHDVTQADFDALENPDKLTDQQLRYALENKKLITSWLDAVESLVTDRLISGETFSGFKLVEGRGSREWQNDAEAEIQLSRLLGQDAYEKKLLSVAKAEKVLGKKKAEQIAFLISRKSGKPTLAPESDKRPSLGATVADFDAIK